MISRRSFLQVLIAVPLAGIVAAKATPTAASPTEGWTHFYANGFTIDWIEPSWKARATRGQIRYVGNLVVVNRPPERLAALGRKEITDVVS